MTQQPDYRPPGRNMRACEYWWFDAWDWLVNRALQFSGSPAVNVREGEIAIDMHVHSMFSHCSISSLDRIFLRAAQVGLGGIAIVDHNTADAIGHARACLADLKRRGQIREDFLLIPGMEMNTRAGHVVALFTDRCPPRDVEPADCVKAIRESGGLAMIPHPFHSTGIREAVFDLDADAVEVECGSVFGAGLVAQNRALIDDPRLARLAKLGTSDAHYTRAIGSCYTALTVAEPTLEAVRQAIADRQTRPVASASYERVQRLLARVSKLK